MPPKKKKKQANNAYYFFMLDWRAEKEEQGQRFSSLAEVSQLCAEDWKHLPDYNMKKYKEMEKKAKMTDKNDLSNKFTAHGVTYQQVENEKREKQLALEKMATHIASTMNTSLGSLKVHHFYLVHANVYCYWGQGQVYIPCEVAISRFNLQEGLVDWYHVFPAPFTPNAKIPLGYKYLARQSAESVHNIPEPSEFEKTEYDWDKIRADISKFLVPDGGGEIPPLYTMPGDDPNINCHMTAVQNFFDNVSNGTDYEFRVYSLPLLFFNLYETCQKFAESLYGDKEKAFLFEGVAHQELLKDVYNLHCGIACSFHDSTDRYYNCSLSFVKRWVFLICEFCCQALRMELIPGRHCVVTARIAPVARDPPRLHSQPPPASNPKPKESLRSHSPSLSKSEVDDDDDSGGACSTVTKAQHGLKNLSVENPLPGAWGSTSRVENHSSGAWSSTSREHKNTNAWPSVCRNRDQQNSRDEELQINQNNDLVIIDHSKVMDPSQARVLRTGQSPNVVSEIQPDTVRRPTTYGRGQLMAHLSSQLSSPGASLSSDDFPAIGASRPGRLAKPMTSSWGRGFLNQQ